MRTLFTTLFVLILSTIASAQFVLGEINEDWFESPYQSGGLFAYLDSTLEGHGGLKVLQRREYTVDRGESPCIIGKSYAGGIYVKEDQGCVEESGSNTWVYLPSETDIDELKAWVEAWNKLYVGEEHGTYSWRGDNFGPPDGEAGCYYSIQKDQYGRIVLELYCGC